MCKKIVKNTYFLLLAVLFSTTMEAKISNYVGAYVQAGEWTLLPSESNYGPSFGGVGGLGFLYEMQLGPKYSPTRFLLDVGVGAQGGLTSFIQGSNMYTTLKDQKDLNGDPFEYVYEINNRHDQYTNIGVQVPIMIGVQHRKFYMLAGVKVNANVYKKAITTATLNTYGHYEDIPDLRGMEEYQFFNNYPLKGTANATLSNINLDASLEIGGRFGGVVITDAVGFDVPKRKVEYRLAGFLDYGLGDIHTQHLNEGFVAPSLYDTNPGSQAYVYNTTSMVDNLKVNDLMSTTNFAKKVTNLVVGIKFSVLFQLPENEKCVICRDAYGSSVRRGRSGGVQYEE